MRAVTAFEMYVRYPLQTELFQQQLYTTNSNLYILNLRDSRSIECVDAVIKKNYQTVGKNQIAVFKCELYMSFRQIMHFTVTFYCEIEL